MKHVPETKVEAIAIEIKDAFEEWHLDKTMSLDTAMVLAHAAVRAAVAWREAKAEERANV